MDAESEQSSSGDASNAAENSTSVAGTNASEAIRADSSQPVEASLVEPVLAETAVYTDFEAGANTTDIGLTVPLPIASNMENMAANGGAIGALVLGIWCVLGSFITNWSIINGVLGLLMGFWGLASRKRRTAWIGIALCVLGILMSLVQVSELINTYLNAVDENPY